MLTNSVKLIYLTHISHSWSW